MNTAPANGLRLDHDRDGHAGATAPRRQRPRGRLVAAASVLAIVAATVSGAAPAAAQTATLGFCIDNDLDTADTPANPGECADGQRYLTAGEKAELDKIRREGRIELVQAAIDAYGTGTSSVPDEWYESSGPCLSIPSTRGSENRIIDVYGARTPQLAAQIAYDIASNEISGISGAITGSILGALSIPAFALEWVYDVQDECQEILHRRAVEQNGVNLIAQSSALSVHANEVRSTLTAIDNALIAHDEKITDQIDAQTSTLSTQIADQTTNLTTQNDAQTTNLNAQFADQTTNLTTQLTDQTTNLTTQNDEHDAHLQAETDELDVSVADARDENLRFFIEDHLDTCRPLASMLVSQASGGYAERTFEVVEALIGSVEAEGIDIGQARRFYETAAERRAAGDARKAFQSLCSAYGHLVNGK